MNYKKRILITGHQGYIGSRLKTEIEEFGNQVIGIDLKSGQDVLSVELPEVDCIYHLAAQSGVPESGRDPINDARQNILGTIRMALHAKKHDIPIVFTTTGASVGEKVSPYGLSKSVAEDYLRLLCPELAIICRLSSVYGDKPKGVVDNFIRDEVCSIFGDGSAVRDFVHVDDIVRGLIQAVGWDAGKYSMGSGEPTAVIDIARATGKLIEHLPSRESDKPSVVLPNSTPDWEPRIKVIDYIKSKS